MFIFLLNPAYGPEEAKNQFAKNKVENPDSLLKPLLANSIDKPDQASSVSPGTDKEAIKHTLIRAMLRAVGQLFDHIKDPSPEMLIKDLERYTNQPATPERQQAFEQFFNALKKEKPDLKDHTEEYFQALIKTWNEGVFESLPKPPVLPREIDQDIEELKKKGIEVLDGGVDPIAGSRITLKIHGKEYTASYGGIGGVYVDSLKSEDGTPVSQDVINLVKENNELITRVGMSMGYHNSIN